MTKPLNMWILAAAAGVGAIACGGQTNTGGETKEIDRVQVPESAFKPEGLEATIDDLIAELGKAPSEKFEMAVVTKPFGGYWEPVKVGANRAMAELGLSGEVVAPADADDPDITTQRQIELLQDRRDTGYGGIAVAPMRESVSVEIDSIVDLGVPVVTLDSDLADSKRNLYIGTNNAEAGKTAGETLRHLLLPGEGTVFVLGYDDVDWPDGYSRSNAARQVLEDAGYTVVVHRIGWTESETATDFEVLTEAVPNADPPTVGMVGMFSNAYRGAQIAEQLGYEPGDLQIVAFDFEPDTLTYMKSGYIQATHVQRQYYMGYLVPYAMYSIRVLGLKRTVQILADYMVDDSRFDSGVDVIWADQTDDYDNFLDSLGIGG